MSLRKCKELFILSFKGYSFKPSFLQMGMEGSLLIHKIGCHQELINILLARAANWQPEMMMHSLDLWRLYPQIAIFGGV